MPDKKEIDYCLWLAAIKLISEQLRRELPRLRGFSEESIKKMRTFSEFWCQYLNQSPMATEIGMDNLQDNIEYDRFSLAKWSTYKAVFDMPREMQYALPDIEELKKIMSDEDECCGE